MQALVNLLHNAAKYSAPGTPIDVDVRRLGATGWARVVVRDHGIGIDEEALEAIFAGHRTERACSTAPGSGIGLRLSRRLVEADGGLLWAMNLPDGGSAFYLELPLADSGLATHDKSGSPAPPAVRPIPVLTAPADVRATARTLAATSPPPSRGAAP